LYLNRPKTPRSSDSEATSIGSASSIRSSTLQPDSIEQRIEHTCGKQNKPRRVTSFFLTSKAASKDGEGFSHLNADKAVQTDPIVQLPFAAPVCTSQAPQSAPLPQHRFVAPAWTSPDDPYRHPTPLSVPYAMPIKMPQQAAQLPQQPMYVPHSMYVPPPPSSFYTPHLQSTPFGSSFQNASQHVRSHRMSKDDLSKQHSPFIHHPQDLTHEEERVLIRIHEHYEKNCSPRKDPPKHESIQNVKGSLKSTSTMEIPQHVCVGCGKSRSVAHHLANPIRHGQQPEAALCRKCTAKSDRIDGEMFDRSRARQDRGAGGGQNSITLTSSSPSNQKRSSRKGNDNSVEYQFSPSVQNGVSLGRERTDDEPHTASHHSHQSRQRQNSVSCPLTTIYQDQVRSQRDHATINPSSSRQSQQPRRRQRRQADSGSKEFQVS